jgi:hypothetical protein
LIAIFFAAGCLPGGPIVADAAESASSSQAPELKDVCVKLEALLHDFYPKAKITTTADSLHFEFKLKSEIGYYSNRQVMAPQDGGILGDLQERPGQYQGQDKDRLPSELPDGFHTTLTMAPYSSASKTCLFTTLMFPPDVNEEFKTHFKEIVNSFASTRDAAPETASAASAGTTPLVAAAAAAPVASAQAVAISQSINSMPATAADAAEGSRTAHTSVTPAAAAVPAAGTSAGPTQSAASPAVAAPNAISQKPVEKTPIAIVPPAAKKPVTTSGASSSSGGLHLFDANSNPIGGTKVGGAATPAAAPKSAGMVKFPKYGYLPVLPIKVQIITSQRLPNGLVNICYFTPDPPKKAESIWRQQIDKTPWSLAPEQVPGQLRMYIKFNVANGTPNQLLNQGNNPFGFGQTVDMSRFNFNQQTSGGYDVAAAIVFTPAKTGTIVNIVYGERH